MGGLARREEAEHRADEGAEADCDDQGTRD